MNKECKLSIIIPVYNVEKYIRRCLDSIYIQSISDKDYEVIIVNDGSPDNSIEIVKEFERCHLNMTVIQQKNQGLSVARNVGLACATGKYIWFVDSDDWLENGALSKVLNIISEDELSIIASNLIISFDDFNKNYIERVIEKDVRIPAYVYISHYSVGAIQRYIIKREILEKNQMSFFPGIYHEDADFAPRLLSYVDNVLLLSSPLYHYYQRESGSIMSSWKIKNTLDYIFVVRRISDFLDGVKDIRIQGALRVYAHQMFYHAFPARESIHPDLQKAISVEFAKNKGFIRHFARKAVFSKNIDIKRRLLFLMSSVSPTLCRKFLHY